MPIKSFWMLLLSLSSLPVHAGPLAEGDPIKGKQLVDKQCIACHAARYDGDGSEIYTRDMRKVKNIPALITQVRACNTNLGLQWFEEDELNVARYLNDTYYKFTE